MSHKTCCSVYLKSRRYRQCSLLRCETLHGLMLGREYPRRYPFLPIRPIWTNHPECRPDATNATWHVRYVGNEEAVIEGFLGKNPYASPAISRDGCRVDTHVTRIVVICSCTNQAVWHQTLIIVERNKSSCGIWRGESVEIGKEIISGIIICETRGRNGAIT